MIGRTPCERQALCRGSRAPAVVAPLAAAPSSGVRHAHANRYDGVQIVRKTVLDAFQAAAGPIYKGVGSIAAAIAAHHAPVHCAGKAAAGTELCRHKQLSAHAASMQQLARCNKQHGHCGQPAAADAAAML